MAAVAASVSQVHRARLKNGREVAVKVKYPTVESVFESDFDTMQAFCKLAQPEQVRVGCRIRDSICSCSPLLALSSSGPVLEGGQEAVYDRV